MLGMLLVLFFHRVLHFGMDNEKEEFFEPKLNKKGNSKLLNPLANSRLRGRPVLHWRNRQLILDHTPICHINLISILMNESPYWNYFL